MKFLHDAHLNQVILLKNVPSLSATIRKDEARQKTLTIEMVINVEVYQCFGDQGSISQRVRNIGLVLGDIKIDG